MKMNKKILASVIALGMLSGSVMADDGWVDNTPTGPVNLGGIVAVTNPVVWQWKTGAGKTDFSNYTFQMDTQKQNLTITTDQDIPLVAARLKNAITGADFEQPNTYPKVTLASKDGAEAAIKFDQNGAVAFDLKTYNGSGDEIGTLHVNATSAGMVAKKNIAGEFSVVGLSAHPGSPFDGVISQYGYIPGATPNATVATKFDAPTIDDIEQQVKAFTGSADAVFTVDDANSVYFHRVGNASSDSIYAVSYGLGIESNKELQLHFNNPVDQTTQWTAPLTINVAYQ